MVEHHSNHTFSFDGAQGNFADWEYAGAGRDRTGRKSTHRWLRGVIVQSELPIPRDSRAHDRPHVSQNVWLFPCGKNDPLALPLALGEVLAAEGLRVAVIGTHGVPEAVSWGSVLDVHPWYRGDEDMWAEATSLAGQHDVVLAGFWGTDLMSWGDRRHITSEMGIILRVADWVAGVVTVTPEVESDWARARMACCVPPGGSPTVRPGSSGFTAGSSCDATIAMPTIFLRCRASRAGPYSLGWNTMPMHGPIKMLSGSVGDWQKFSNFLTRRASSSPGSSQQLNDTATGREVDVGTNGRWSPGRSARCRCSSTRRPAGLRGPTCGSTRGSWRR